MTTFWLLAPIMVIAALGLLFARKAVHAALALAVVMISLAILYAAQGAPFLFAVQIIVYTGAIMMLFLFVLMLVGVETSEAVRETISGQRLAAIVIGLLFGVTAVLAIGQTVTGTVVGLDRANANGNPYGLADLLFGKYVLAFEFTSALLITAALGAMVLAHKERLTKRQTQADIAARRMREYAETGRHPGNAPTPGVFARHNAVDTPALLPDGTPLDASVSPSIAERGQVRSGFSDDVARTADQLEHEDDPDSSGSGLGGPK
ncbi:NADH-quinone oxidoreductase subunit J [Aeromicrobium sp. SMF47]|uniref:NADH-quinone oxidoreductase subunit J n=1 Tax=Aeromicrobium yanjiei TaxID=2662028 RepID=A0A5Q2MPU6_9ACTN|nr:MULTISPECIES: NADH-quinone oxidoreductase subunit J [Aeromicrobium]MRJ76085.1 NADH-quinone oxidoreductase subunit J [Aeromicrobium yanjiei]MRK00435.1 NADH-quinone oxidoreductase subunit J [Aeromicrobium sp. S22]QGG42695.1 NADH-quinone oxidoreductase subunit J [Aeromicrobium yanjiei]